MLAHRGDCLGVGRLGAGPEDDRHSGRATVRNWFIAGQEDDDPIVGQVIADVGRYPWGVSILAAGSPNYCH